MATNDLKLLLWNARAIARKCTELLDLLSRLSVDILVATETHLKPGMKFNLPGFNIVRLDRTQTKGGGVLIAVRSNLKFAVQPHYKTTVIEALGVVVPTQTGEILVIAAYCPKQCVSSNGSSRSFKNDLAKLTRTPKKFIVAGDLNARHELWHNHRRNSNGMLLFEDAQLGYYTVNAPSDPTFVSRAGVASTLDLFLTNANNIIGDPVTITELSSDHYPVQLQINSTPNFRPQGSRKDYRHVNWVEFQRRVDRRIDTLVPLATAEDIDRELTNLQEAIAAAEDECVRRVPASTVSNPFEIDPVTKALITKRNTVRRRFQRTGNPRERVLAARLTEVIRDRITELRNNKFQNNLYKLDSRSNPFWKLAKILKSKPQQMPALKVDDTLLITPEEKSNAIAQHFVASHKLGSAMTSPMEPAVQETIATLNNTRCYVPNEKKITVDEISAALKNSKNMKAPGFDSIFNILLKHLSSRTLTHLANILNKCMDLQYFPSTWKCAKVVPILKPGKDPTSPSSYRPISLLSSISKIFERLILNRVLEHIEMNRIIPNEQFGFRKNHSTTHQLNRVAKFIHSNKSVAKSTAMVLLDIEKAFDNVWHEGLLYKLYRYNFPIYLIKLIQNYLSGRSFKVVLNSIPSETNKIPAGVPQGSLLGPILYNIYTSDIPQPPQDCHLSLYADDTSIMAKGRNTRATTRKLQNYLDTITDYMQVWKIKINNSKTQAILFPYNKSYKLNPPEDCKIVIGGNAIEWSQEAVYLGITLDKKLLFRTQIEKTKTKCQILLKKLYPLISRNSKLSIINKAAVYNQIVLPVILYGSPVWDNCAKTHKDKLQVIQNKYLRLIYNLSRFTRVSAIHQIAEIKTIDEQLTQIKQKFIQKCQTSEYDEIRGLFPL